MSCTEIGRSRGGGRGGGLTSVKWTRCPLSPPPFDFTVMPFSQSHLQPNFPSLHRRWRWCFHQRQRRHGLDHASDGALHHHLYARLLGRDLARHSNTKWSLAERTAFSSGHACPWSTPQAVADLSIQVRQPTGRKRHAIASWPTTHKICTSSAY